MMKTPRYTDAEKYPHGYTPHAATDIRRTFARVRAEQRKAQEEQAKKVTPLKARKP